MNYQAPVKTTLLEVRNLRTEFQTASGTVKAVDGVSFTIERGERLAIVGESGSGKSAMAMSILRLLTHPGKVVGGEVLLDGRDISCLSEGQLNAIRGRLVGTVFQDPMSSLDPVMRISRQMIEPIMRNLRLNRDQARAEAIKWLGKVGIPEPERRIEAYPFEMSGGMRQRVMIAMALASRPQLVIADEPTTALDVTIQAQILALIRRLQEETGTAMILITHDLGVVAEVADQVAVMYAGHIVESGPVEAIFDDPQHPYTIGLMGSVPSLGRRAGLVRDDAWRRLQDKEEGIRRLTGLLRAHKHEGETLEKWLRRTEIDWPQLAAWQPELAQFPCDVIEQVVLEAKYAGYIDRQAAQIERFRGAVDAARRDLKPSIPEVGDHGIPIHDELVLERWLAAEGDAGRQDPRPPSTG